MTPLQASGSRSSNEARFRDIADHAPVMMWVTDPSGYCIYLNRRWYEFTGQSKAEAEGFGWLDATHPDDKARTEEAFHAANAERLLFQIEYRLRRADGSYRWVLDTASPRLSEAGEFLGYVGSVIDIHERIQAEERLRESEDHFRHTVELNPQVPWTADPDGNITSYSSRWLEMTGQTPDEPYETGWAKAVHPEDLTPTLARYSEALAAGEPIDVEYRIRIAATGEHRWMRARAYPRRGKDGGIVRWYGVVEDIHDRKVAEQALREREAQLSLVLDSALDAFLAFDAEWRLTVFNAQAERFFGMSRGEVLGRHLWDVFPQAVSTDIERRFRRVMEQREAETFEVRSAVHSGRIVEMHAAPKPDGGVAASFTDITDRKQAEAALQESQAKLAEERARLTTLVDNLPVGVCFIDPDGNPLLSNPAFRHFIPSGIIPSRLDDAEERWLAWDENGRQLVRNDYPAPRALRGETVPSTEFLHRSDAGQEIWTRFSSVPLHNSDGQIGGALLVIVDIDEQKRAQEMLRRLNETLEAQVAERTAERDRVWENSNELMAVFGFDGKRRAINPAWSRVLGYDEETLLNAPFMEITHPDDRERLKEQVQKLARGERIAAFEDRLRCADGSYRTISWTGVPGDGVFYGIGRDITEYRQAEEALRQAQKMEAIGQLTGGVAHDFNNLLTIIRSSTDLLRRPDLAEERRRRYVDAISDTVDRAAKLTGQLLAFARRQALKPEVFDVADRVRGITDMLRTIVGSRIQIETEVECDRCFVEADLTQFETAMVNMAVNARDAMNGEGTLKVRVQAMAAMPAIRGHAGGPGDFVAISMTDTGSGIPADKLPYIFEPFFTTKEVGKGTGLGLSQVYGFAKQSGGDVAVESTVGRGTTFTLYLQRVDEEPDGNAAGSSREEGVETGKGRRVLVVEDNVEVGQFATQILQDLGYAPIWAANADEGLKLLAANPNGFDVVFSDVVMPGMSGLELGRLIRQRYPKLPVVLTSGYSHVLAEEGRHGFELLQKPYAAEELSRVLRRLVRDGRAPEPV
jgi:PAS domain S-box-containing protein